MTALTERGDIVTGTGETKKRTWIVWAALAAAALVLWLGIRPIPAVLELLDTVNVPRECVFSVRDRVRWEDWLNYVAGHDIIAVEISPEEWQIPEDWTEESVTLDELQRKCDVRLSVDAMRELNIGTLPEEYDAWFFREDQQASECWVGMYSDSGVLIVYHGLELWVAGGYWDRYD